MPLRWSAKGFTLIELVVGMVITAISLAMLSALIYPQLQRSVNPILAVRAAELGQALMEEILAKRFDENSPLGGMPACSADCSSTLGADGSETRLDFDDVDDFNVYCGSQFAIQTALGITPAEFARYRMEICVNYDGDFDGNTDTGTNAKLITVSVFPPLAGGGQDAPISFSAYKGNF